MSPCIRGAILFFVLLAPSLTAQASALSQAGDLYRTGDYAGAKEAYTQVWDEGLRDGGLEYNLGNCWWRLGEPARALVHYRRALAWTPRDGDTKANRDLCRKVLGLDRSTTVPFLRALVASLTAFTAAELAGLALAGSLLLFGALALRCCWRHRLPLLLALAGAAALLTGGGQLLWRQVERPPVALVLADSTRLRSEPRAELEPVVTLGAGVEVRILGREGSWCRVDAGSHKGWLPAERLGRIDWRSAPWFN